MNEFCNKLHFETRKKTPSKIPEQMWHTLPVFASCKDNLFLTGATGFKQECESTLFSLMHELEL